MERIVFAVVLALGLALSPVAGDAQQAANVPRIGFLGLASAAIFGKQMEALRAGLRDQGYVEGKTVVIEYRWAEGKYDRLPDLAGELVRLRVDVLVTHGTPGLSPRSVRPRRFPSSWPPVPMPWPRAS